MKYDPDKMNLTVAIALEVAHVEALIRQAYKDGGGVWTWSVGLTNATGHRVSRYIGKPASLSRCMSVFIWALDNYADAVRDVFDGYPLTEEQFAAALSFHWNTGAIRTAAWVRHFKAGDMDKARTAFLNYSRPASIIPRREGERDLFFGGDWQNNGKMPEYTRVTRNHTPVWSSRVDTDVADIIAEQIKAHSV